MFEWILFGLIAAVTVAACVTIDTLRKAMTKAKINFGEIIDLDRVHNKVTLQDLESRARIEVTGDDISNEIYRGRKIRVAIAPKNEEHDSWFTPFTPEEEAIGNEMLERLKTDPDALACQQEAEAIGNEMLERLKTDPDALACQRWVEEHETPFVKG